MHDLTLAATPRLALLACLLCLIVPASSLAQPVAARGARSAPPEQSIENRASILESWTNPDIATLMLVDSLERPTARAMVIRRPGELPNNIILVTRATTPADLARAVSALIGSRISKGDRVDREIRAFIAPVSESNHKPTRDHLRAAGDLRRLERAPGFAIAGLATGPAVVIRLRPLPSRGAVKP